MTYKHACMHAYMHTCIHAYIHDGLPTCLFLVLLINSNSLRAASFFACKTMIDLNSLKPWILSFIFQAVAKTCSKCQRVSL